MEAEEKTQKTQPREHTENPTIAGSKRSGPQGEHTTRTRAVLRVISLNQRVFGGDREGKAKKMFQAIVS